MKMSKVMIGIGLFLTVALASAVDAEVNRTATATISPTEVDGGVTTTFTLVLTNTGDASQKLGSASVQIPDSFTVHSASVTGYPTGKEWHADLGGTTIDLHPTPGAEGTKKLATGQSVTVQFLATAPTPDEDTMYEWTTGASSETTWPGSANFTISSQPAVLVRAPTIIEAIIDIDPDTLNLDSNGQVVTCYIMLPEEYDVADIEIDSILLNDEIEVAIKNDKFWCALQDSDADGVFDLLMVKFDRVVVQELVDEILLVGDEVELTVTGTVGGIPFIGSDTITIK